ncbi:hypothetical protein PLGE761_05965 [Pluralibacter gergoviae]
MRPGVGADDIGAAVHARRDLAGGAFVGLRQAQAGQVRQVQRPFAAVIGFASGAGFCNVAQRVGPDVAKAIRVFGSADTKRVQHHNKCTFHKFSGT